MDINSVLIIISRAVNEENLSVAGVICVGRTRVWGVGTPRPPVEERNAAPQTPLRKVRFVGGGVRRSLYSRIQLGQIDCVLNLAGGQRSLDRLNS